MKVKSHTLDYGQSDGLRHFIPSNRPSDGSKTVVVRFVKDCGLGNQMFEWAAGLAVARRLGLPMMWDWQPTPKREFGLKHFGFGVQPFADHPVVSSRLGQGNIRILDHAAQAVFNSEHLFPAISHPFQAEECFAEVAEEVREIFKLDPLPLDIPEGRTPVAVQVRRGDYVGHPRLNVCTLEYFLNGIDFVRQRIAHPQFFVVSDDPAWCVTHLGHLPDVTVMPPQEPIDGLRTMVACEAHVISNSTFGWWGAWLVDKLVVVPEIWHHRPGSYGNWKPAPDRWHRVSIGRPITVKPVVSKPVPPVAFRRHKTEFERAVVIPWHADQDKWQSLRYCLRSLHANLEDKKCPIVILGTRRPSWLLYGNHRVRFEEAWSYQDALMRGVQIADEVLWMNDDIQLLRPTGWDDMRRPLHFGPVTPEFLDDFRARPNPWRDGFVKAVEWLQGQGVAEVMNFSTHIPYVFTHAEATDVLKRTGAAFKQPFETLYFNLHGTGARQMRDERTQVVSFGEARYLNYTNNLLTLGLKEAIKTRFPEFAPWEIRVKFDA